MKRAHGEVKLTRTEASQSSFVEGGSAEPPSIKGWATVNVASVEVRLLTEGGCDRAYGEVWRMIRAATQGGRGHGVEVVRSVTEIVLSAVLLLGAVAWIIVVATKK